MHFGEGHVVCSAGDLFVAVSIITAMKVKEYRVRTCIRT